MNATLADDIITRHGEVHMGVAVALPEGLMVPVLHNAHEMSLLQIAKAARELAGRARDGRLSPDDMSGGTFTITNMAHSVVDFFTPILLLRRNGHPGRGPRGGKARGARRRHCGALHDGPEPHLDHRVEGSGARGGILKTVTEYLATRPCCCF